MPTISETFSRVINPRNVFELLFLKLDAEDGRDIRFGAAKPTKLDQFDHVADFFSLPPSIPGDRDNLNPALEYVFQITQNVDRNWVQEVTSDEADWDLAVFGPTKANGFRDNDAFYNSRPRSTSVGDVILYVPTNTYYLVSGFGFEKIALS